MNTKKVYVKPLALVENVASVSSPTTACSNIVTSYTISCLANKERSDYEALVYGWELSPYLPLDSPEVQEYIYSDDRTCLTSCYQGPYDSIFSS